MQPKYRVDEKKLFKEKSWSLETARELFPEWYQKRIVEKEKAKGHWTCKRDLYDWWLRQIQIGATFHHRYFNLMCLAIYAAKSGISEEEVRLDAYSLVPFLDSINPDEPMTIDDIESALECYDERYCTFPIDDISRLSGIQIEKNKRNGRPRAIHIARVNQMRKFDRDVLEEDPYINNGRPSMAGVVKWWRQMNPDGTKAECIRETGLARSTVWKWWDAAKPKKQQLKNENKGRPTKRKEVQTWRQMNPDGTKAECIRETSLSKATVSKWWNMA